MIICLPSTRGLRSTTATSLTRVIKSCITEVGLRVMQDFITRVSDVAVVERRPLVEGRHMIMILAPKDAGKESGKAGKDIKKPESKASDPMA